MIVYTICNSKSASFKLEQLKSIGLTSFELEKLSDVIISSYQSATQENYGTTEKV